MEQIRNSFLRKDNRLGRLFVGGMVLVALGALVVAMVRFRGHFRSPALTTPVTGPPVLLITIDTLRADHVGCYGYSKVETPAMDFLAAQGVRFDDALAQVPLTPPSHMVILSGTYPMWNGLRDFSVPKVRQDAQIIAEAFARHGYETAAFVSTVVLSAFWGMSRGFETYDAQIEFPRGTAGSDAERRAGETIDHVLAWFQAHDPGRTGAKPFFVWVHLYDPHWRYDPPEPFHTQYSSHLYDGEIAYADSQLGRLFDYLREKGVYDRALIVLVADHGESLGEHGEVEHGYFIYRSTLRVPLIFKLPRAEAGAGEGRVIETPVGAIDVAPTLLELTHLQDPISRQFQGASLAGLVLNKTKATERPVYSESYYAHNSYGWGSLRSISTAQYQYIAAPRPELYDVIRDPSEKHNVYAQHGADAAALHDQLLDIDRRYTDRTSSPTSGAPLSAETVEKLRSLGYVAFSAPASTVPDNDLPDPKDQLQIFNAVWRAQRCSSIEECQRADAPLKEISVKEPGQAGIPCQLGMDAAKEKRWADAERYFLAALKLNPALTEAINTLVDVYREDGKLDESRRWLEVEISEQPQDFLAYQKLGELARDRSDMQEALGDFQKAVAINPDFSPAQEGLGLALVDANRYGEAVKPLEAAASLGLDHQRLYYGLAMAYLNTHQTQKAIAAAQKGLAIRGNPAGHLNHALSELADGNRQNALNEFRALCNDNPEDCRQYEKFFQ